MNKQELVDAISSKTGINKKTTHSILNALLESVVDALKQDDTVRLVGFGSFKVTQRAARKGRNPQTKKLINISARKTPKFIPGKPLKELIK